MSWIKAAAGKGEGPGRLPVLITAFVWPGLGQFMQRRWFSAAVFSLGFLACTVVFFVLAFRILSAYYGLWLHFDNYVKPDLPLRGVLVSFVAGLLLYIAAIFDAYIGYVRQRSQWNAARHLEPPKVPGRPPSLSAE